MKYKIFFIFIFVFNSIFSQENTITVTYKIYPTYQSIENDVEFNPKNPDFFKGVDKELNNIEYELQICQDVSFYKVKPIIPIDLKKANIALSFSGRGEYRINSKEKKVICKKNYLGEDFLIEMDSLKKWQITKESKFICGYLCFKANLSYTKNKSSTKSQTYNVIAWFCPQIPVSHGPKGFYGLPGLIIELSDDRITYVATKIDLDKKQSKNTFFEINKPVVSENDFYIQIEKNQPEWLKQKK